MDNESYNLLWSQALVEELYRHGITFFCISPGSRSSPITITIAKSSYCTSNVFIDERSASYFALGYSKHRNDIPVLVCTSGTAPANYLPAVIEAYYTFTPLIILSCDRPPEQIDTSSNQTIKQTNLYGEYCSFSTMLPPPSKEISLEYVLTTIDLSITKAYTTKRPIHINCAFREPLLPEYTNLLSADSGVNFSTRLQAWQHSSHPYTSYDRNVTKAIDVKNITQSILQAKTGLVIVGNLEQPQELSCLYNFFEILGWPVYADITSGLKHTNYMVSANEIAQIIELNTEKKIDMIIFLGDRVVSKLVYQFLESNAYTTYYKILNQEVRSDPTHRVTHKLTVDIGLFCQEVSQSLKQYDYQSVTNLSNDQTLDAYKRLENLIKTNQTLNHISAIQSILAYIKKTGYSCFLGNSLTIRLANDFTRGYENIITNRGTSGIEGNIATALGYAHAIQNPVCAIIGDLACIHDMNSLTLLSQAQYPILLVIMNDRGGNIFSTLPIGKQDSYQDIFTKHFMVPHEISFAKVAFSLGITSYQVNTKKQLNEVLGKTINNLENSCLIEVITAENSLDLIDEAYHIISHR